MIGAGSGPSQMAIIGHTALGIPQGDACFRRDARNHRYHRKEPSQMEIYWGRLKARNYTKLYSKLYKPSWMAIIGHTDITESTEMGAITDGVLYGIA